MTEVCKGSIQEGRDSLGEKTLAFANSRLCNVCVHCPPPHCGGCHWPLAPWMQTQFPQGAPVVCCLPLPAMGPECRFLESPLHGCRELWHVKIAPRSLSLGAMSQEHSHRWNASSCAQCSGRLQESRRGGSQRKEHGRLPEGEGGCFQGRGSMGVLSPHGGGKTASYCRMGVGCCVQRIFLQGEGGQSRL